MKKIDAMSLGGTLFVPATHKHLPAIASAQKFPALRSVVFDTEDGLDAIALEEGMEIIRTLLPTLHDVALLRFIRPRNPEVLRLMLEFDGIGNIDGFILPKFGLENAETYLASLAETPFLFMPSIEGNELFDVTRLQQLRALLLPFKERIPAVRFGAEDMFRQLGLRRECSVSLYDMAAPSVVIGNLLTTFRPYGFELSAPVYRCYRNHDGFAADVKRDLQEGFVSKTIIHPDQIALLEQAYAVEKKAYEAALRMTGSGEAVFAHAGEMAETATQHPWAARLLRQAELYGIV